MASAQDVVNEVGVEGRFPIDNYDVDRVGPDFEGKPRVKLGVREAIARVLFELTLWVPTLSGDELRARTGRHVETALGHARDGASWGKDNNMQGRDIQVKCDRILHNQRLIMAALKIEGGK